MDIPRFMLNIRGDHREFALFEMECFGQKMQERSRTRFCKNTLLGLMAKDTVKPNNEYNWSGQDRSA